MILLNGGVIVPGGDMGGEPQSAETGDKLDRDLHSLKAVWFGMFAGGFIITLTLAVIVTSGGGARIDLGALNYLFLLPVPFGLFGAFVLVPWLTATDPAAVPPPEGIVTADDPMDSYPAFMSRFLLRAGFLEGNAILSAIGFFITADWVILGGPAILLAALLACVPTRAAVETYADEVRQRTRSGG
jgi:hypothetical protein